MPKSNSEKSWVNEIFDEFSSMVDANEEKMVETSNRLHAEELAKVFFGNYDEKAKGVTHIGLVALFSQFGKVPEQERANVYVMFKEILDNKNIETNRPEWNV